MAERFRRLGRHANLLALLLAVIAPCMLPAQTELIPGVPVDHFRIYGFDKANGWRTWQLEGAKAELTLTGLIQITDLRLRVFEASEKQIVNLTIESNLARMTKARDSIEGPGTIVVTAKGVFLGGQNWTWQPEERKLVIRSGSHVVLDGELGPILE